MVRRALPVPLFLPRLDPAAAEPLQRQLYFALREAILSGLIAAGARLPSSRALAAELGLSRNTVLAAFEQLQAEGWIESRQGSGAVAARPGQSPVRPEGREPSAPPQSRRLSRRAQQIQDLAGTIGGSRLMAFQPGLPAIDQFPFAEWSRILGRRWRRPPRALILHDDPAGWRPLREHIADYLRTARAVSCTADQVIVAAGAQQALDLAARVLLDPGEAVWVEDPGYRGIKGALAAAGARLAAVPLDAEGFDVGVAERLCPQARIACVTPSHHYPLGVTMTLARRMALLDWAARCGGWIIEDDYDSDFRYSGRPLAAMQGLDAQQRTIYIGTFSKVMFPSLRLGYLVVPGDLLPAFLAARRLADSHPSAIAQAALAEFCAEGHFNAHLRRMRGLYAERQAAFLAAAKAYLGTRLELQPSDAGLHLSGWLPEGSDDRAVSAAAAAQGVAAPPLSAYCVTGQSARPGLVLGYAAVGEGEMRRGIEGLARALVG